LKILQQQINWLLEEDAGRYGDYRADDVLLQTQLPIKVIFNLLCSNKTQ
jgi:hypothetical protein